MPNTTFCDLFNINFSPEITFLFRFAIDDKNDLSVVLSSNIAFKTYKFGKTFSFEFVFVTFAIFS